MLILDRFDKNIAYISTENGMLAADRNLISPEVCEGDVLRVCGEQYIKDEEATLARRARIREFIKNRLKLRT